MALDVNVASREDLVALMGIGEERADAIIQARPFNSTDDLLSIPGIGQRTLEGLKEQGLTVVSKQIKEETMADQMEEMFVGDMTMPGEEMAVAGEMEVMPGEEVAVAGEVEVMPGEEVAVAGEVEVMPGEEMAVAGEMEVMPGEEMAVAGEIQAVELTGTWRLILSLTSLNSSGRS
jgi:hypothetical protein